MQFIEKDSFNSRKAYLLTLSYRIVKRIRRMDLVTQRERMKVSGLRDKITNSDMEGRAFDEHWSDLPLELKAWLFLFLPIYVVNLFLFGPRETLAENMAIEDLPSSDKILLQDENFEKPDNLLLDERDQQLITHLKKLYDSHAILWLKEPPIDLSVP